MNSKRNTAHAHHDKNDEAWEFKELIHEILYTMERTMTDEQQNENKQEEKFDDSFNLKKLIIGILMGAALLILAKIFL